MLRKILSFVALGIVSIGCATFATEGDENIKGSTCSPILNIPKECLLKCLTIPEVTTVIKLRSVCKIWCDCIVDSNSLLIKPSSASSHIFIACNQEDLSSLLQSTMRVYSLGIQFNPSSWDGLKKFSHLRRLEIASDIKVPLSFCSELLSRTCLNQLNLQGDNFENPSEGVASLTQLKLDWLSIDNHSLGTNGACDKLKDLTTLRTLFIRENSLDNLSFLTGLTNLTMLDIANNNPGSLKPITSLTNLATLYSDWNKLRPDDIQHIATLSTLKGLNLGYNFLLESSLKNLTSLINLEYAILSGNNLNSEEGEVVVEFLKTNNSKLEITT